jgi:uncharacterized protein (DUF2235 family)
MPNPAAPDPVRKLIVCCDGTWNEPYKEPTNVVKMLRAIRPTDDQGVAQLVYYDAGVGTGNLVDRFMGGTLGVGLSKNVREAYDFLANNFVDGDKIFLFGFSRGAFTVRSLAGLVGLIGLLEKADMDLFPFVYEIYRSREHRGALKKGTKQAIDAALRALFSEQALGKNFARLSEAILRARPSEIFFIGVWDTVGSLGIPAGPLRWVGQSQYNFHDTDLSDRIRFAYHALAIDERRNNFAPTLWTRPTKPAGPKGALKQTFEQVWFAGAHSNVGGGYPDCGLSDIAFLWMAAKAAAASREEDKKRPLAFDEQYLKQKIDQSLGLLVDSRKGVWKALPAYERPLLAAPPAGKETCEAIHWSAQFRFKCSQDIFAPFPYQPANLKTALEGHPSAIAQLSDFERSYRSWPKS